MKKLLIALLAITCVACAPVVTKVNIPDIGKSDAVQLTDMRPASEKEHEIFSLLITNKEYGIWRVGDVQLSPSPVKLLQYELAKQPNADSATSKVVVRHFVVYANMQSQLRHDAVGAGIGGVIGGLIGNAMADHNENALTSDVNEHAFDAMATDEYKRGLYTITEDPDKASVFIVYIEKHGSECTFFRDSGTTGRRQSSRLGLRANSSRCRPCGAFEQQALALTHARSRRP